jgi:hypothetical protein
VLIWWVDLQIDHLGSAVLAGRKMPIWRSAHLVSGASTRKVSAYGQDACDPTSSSFPCDLVLEEASPKHVM